MQKKKTKAKGNRPKRNTKRPVSVRLAAPTALGSVVVPRNPSYKNTDQKVTVSHRELVCAVDCKTTFPAGLKRLEVNPGLELSFPWLHHVARGYEFYRFKSLRFIYEPNVSTATNGSIIMAMDYDAGDAAPGSREVLSCFSGSVRSQMWSQCVMVCAPQELARFHDQRACRFVAISANQDVKTYDLGNLFISIQGNTEILNAGDVYVEYVVDLMSPQIPTAFEAAYYSSHIASYSPTLTAPFTNNVITGHEDFEINAAGDSITGKTPGEYEAWFSYSGTVVAAITPTLTAVGATAVAAILANTVGRNSAETLGNCGVRFKVVNYGDGIKLDFTPTAATLTGIITRIAPYLYSLE